MIATSILVLNAGYGFEGTLTPLADFDFSCKLLTQHSNARGEQSFPQLSKIPLPFPRAFIEGLDLQQFEFDQRKRSFLCGRWKLGGWWYYYAFAALIKMPIGFWMMAIQAAWFPPRLACGLSRTSSPTCTFCLFLPFAVLMLLVSAQTGFSRHFRYVFPCLPFLFIWASQAAAWIDVPSRLRRLALIALIGFVTSSLFCWPFQHSYFNLLAGGPQGGHRFLLDANIDWGEDVLHAERWANRHPECRPLYRVFVHDEFAAHRRCDWMQASALQPGWYLISIHRLLDPADPFSCLQRFRPVHRIGFSTLVYHINGHEASLIPFGTPLENSSLGRDLKQNRLE